MVQIPLHLTNKSILRATRYYGQFPAEGCRSSFESKSELTQRVRVCPGLGSIAHCILQSGLVHSTTVIGNCHNWANVLRRFQFNINDYSLRIRRNGIVDNIGNGRVETVSRIPKTLNCANGIRLQFDFLDFRHDHLPYFFIIVLLSSFRSRQ